MEENQDRVEIVFHNLPVLSPETLLPAVQVQVLILSHGGQNISHELIYFYFHNYILLSERYLMWSLRWQFFFAPAS